MRIKQSAAVVTMLLASNQAIRMHDAPASNKNSTGPANSGLINLEAQIEKHHANKVSALQKKI
jgi:hypothetical protein